MSQTNGWIADQNFVQSLNAIDAAYEKKAAEFKQQKSSPAVNTEQLRKSIAEKKSALTENKVLHK
jgi:hypothetical protein